MIIALQLDPPCTCCSVCGLTQTGDKTGQGWIFISGQAWAGILIICDSGADGLELHLYNKEILAVGFGT